MMGVSHSYTGVAVGIAGASLVLPHPVTWLDLAGAALAAGGVVGLVAAALPLLLGAILLPGFLLPDPLIPAAPAAVVFVFVMVAGGAALLPDVDTPSSTASNVLGPLSRMVGSGLERLSLTVYHATRLDSDTPNRKGGHRLLTHTYLGAAGFAVVFAATGAVSPIAGAVSCGFVAALLATAARRFLRQIPVLRESPGFGLAVITGIVSWHAYTAFPAWSAAFPAAVFLGCVIHREGDWCTNSGVPRRLWPLPEDGGQRRWALHTAPRTFSTGHDEERFVVRPAIAAATVLATVVAALLPALGPALVVAADRPALVAEVDQ